MGLESGRAISPAFSIICELFGVGGHSPLGAARLSAGRTGWYRSADERSAQCWNRDRARSVVSSRAVVFFAGFAVAVLVSLGFLVNGDVVERSCFNSLASELPSPRVNTRGDGRDPFYDALYPSGCGGGRTSVRGTGPSRRMWVCTLLE